jgi:hypothetical protein
MREMKGWRLFYQNPLGLDLEWTNVDDLHLHLFFILLSKMSCGSYRKLCEEMNDQWFAFRQCCLVFVLYQG